MERTQADQRLFGKLGTTMTCAAAESLQDAWATNEALDCPEACGGVVFEINGTLEIMQ
jgi:hypothetical protein